MTPECEKLQAFSDGELAPVEADAFRAHLAGCGRCERGLLELMQLAALGAELAAPGLAQALPQAPAPRRDAPIADLTARRRRRAYVAAPLLAAAAALAIWIGSRVPGTPAPMRVALAEVRSFEPRVSWPDGDRFRPYDVSRAGGPATREDIPHKTLAALEDGGDARALVGAYLLRGDERQAEAALARQGDTPDAHSDRAARALQKGQAEAALASADLALEAQPVHAQAQWNRALALRDLGLPLSAAAAFDAVAARGEPGWSEEAQRRATALRARVVVPAQSWQQLRAAGDALVDSGTPMPEAMVAAHPAAARLYLYHALRAAPTRERALALAGLAENLDRRFGEATLTAAVARIAAADFAVRAPLAAAFAGLEQQSRVGRADRVLADRLVTAARRAPARAEAADIVLGTLLVAGLGDERPDDLEAAVRALDDPFFAVVPARARALRLRDAGDANGADRALRAALADCRAPYRCMQLEYELGETQIVSFHRPLEARRHLLAGLRLARELGDWSHEGKFLPQLGQASHLLAADALARAYLEEAMRRTDHYGEGAEYFKCNTRRWVRVQLTTLEIDRLQFTAALAHWRAATPCGDELPELHDLQMGADLARLGGTAEESQRLLAELERVRAAAAAEPGGAAAGVLAAADYVEGRVRSATSAVAAEPLLRRAIDRARQAPPDDVMARKARAYSYQTLIALAGVARDHAGALALFAEELGVEPAARCVLGVTTDDDRVVVAARDATGTPHGLVRTRVRPDEDAARVVPAEIVTALRACPQVSVIARAPLHGTQLLPPELAWSFVGPAPPRGGASTPAGKRRVIVTDPEPPAELELPRVGAWSGRSEPGTTIQVAGAQATPARVLEELRTATEVEIHAHGVVNSGDADTSLLALTPDAAGKFWLSAQDLAGVQLAGRPLVVLAACETTESAPYLHETWNLPAAFVAAGARAVLASGAPIPDADAARFFDGVIARIDRGTSVAQAVRDERVAWLARDPHSWVGHVLVFESL